MRIRGLYQLGRLAALAPMALGLGLQVGCDAPTSAGSAAPMTGAATAAMTAAATAATAMGATADARGPRPVPKPDAKVSSVTGDVKAMVGDLVPAALAVDGELEAGTVVTVPEGASVVLVLEDEGQVTLNGPVVAAITHNERREWAVISGRADFVVKRAVGRDSFQVRTVGGLFRIKGGPPPNSGATFSMSVGDDGATLASVGEGTVELIDENAEFKMELDRAEEIRARADAGPGAVPSKLTPPMPRAEVTSGGTLEVDVKGKPGKGMPAADVDAAAWLAGHVAAKPAKAGAMHLKTLEKLLKEAAGRMSKSDEIRNSHKELLEDARAARDAKDEDKSRKLKATLVANTRQARALGRWAHRDVTVATLYKHAVAHLATSAADEALSAKLAKGSALETELADLIRRTAGLRRRPKVSVPGMGMPHRGMMMGKGAAPGMAGSGRVVPVRPDGMGAPPRAPGATGAPVPAPAAP